MQPLVWRVGAAICVLLFCLFWKALPENQDAALRQVAALPSTRHAAPSLPRHASHDSSDCVQGSRDCTSAGDSVRTAESLKRRIRELAMRTDLDLRSAAPSASPPSRLRAEPIANGKDASSASQGLQEQMAPKQDSGLLCADHKASTRQVPSNKSHVFVYSQMSEHPELYTERFTTDKKITYTYVIDQTALRDVLGPSIRGMDQGVVVTFSTSHNTQFVINWLVALSRLHLRDFIVIALDEPLHLLLCSHRLPSFRLKMDDQRAGRFWRVVMWRVLLSMNFSFIFSDIDAVWLQDPTSRFLAGQPHGLLISQGSVSPPPLVDRWGHVVSDGFFFAKPTELTKEILWQVLKNLKEKFYMSPQDGFNIAIATMGIKWKKPKRYTKVFSAGFLVRCYQEDVVGSFPNRTETISMLPHAYFMHHIIKVAQGSNETAAPYIVKVFYNRKFSDADAKIAAMVDKGMWYLKPDWRDARFNGDAKEWLHSVEKNVKLNVFYTAKELQTRHYLHHPVFPPDNATHYYLQSEMSESPNVTEYEWDTEFFHFTLAIDKRALATRLRACAVANTVIVAFSNMAFYDMLLNWLVGVHRIGLRNYLVFALDRRIRDALSMRGIPTFFIGIKHVTALLSVRTVLWHSIADVGVSFIQTDIDAVWLRNPLASFFHPKAPHDIVFTQGTISPPITHDSWGFVLCSGVFYARATPLSADLLYRVLENQLLNPLVPRRYTDQDALNIVIRQHVPKWRIVPGTKYSLAHNGETFVCSEEPMVGEVNATGATVAIAPYHLFMRTVFAKPDHVGGVWQAPYIKHFFSVNRDRLNLTKTSVLTDNRLWMLRPDWNSSRLRGTGGTWLSSLLHPDFTVAPDPG